MPVSSTAEYNTIITMLGALCATVQAITGIYAAYVKKKVFLIKKNEVLFRSHRAFGGFATMLYLLGLFAGVTGFIDAITKQEVVPFEIDNLSFNFHTWPSFLIAIIILYKTFLSYFDKQKIYKQAKWLGSATFLAWAYTWITAAISYYERTVFPNLQHEPPIYLLPYNVYWIQILLPFIFGGIISIPILLKAKKFDKGK
ncbi:hypothetical protein DSAG12_01064 [Promethearchaeum syntrophicum]|uniref:Uncharacterized protein n=1 Tax=Promethearchaeum syntrophicum TaxID=2594042 RepID=A0A5B9D7S2_9ARCH|nr:hypothetical protein [Candidatus Prometheoarchaeum syntrophicum]QEE15239.1 hypothetical protein DSAG12_01064 [Candidatus Prometheoarchaeum syntrophicum]